MTCPAKTSPESLIKFISALPDLGYKYIQAPVDSVGIRLYSSDEIAHRIVGELIAADWQISQSH